EEQADPNVQLAQAILQEQEQHRQLDEKAPAVVTNQKQGQKRLDRALAEYDKANRTAGKALLLADQAVGTDPAQVERFNAAAHASGERVLHLRGEIDDLQQVVLVATAQAEEA